MFIITGGAGFIGSNLVAGLESAGYKNLVVVDRLDQGDKWQNIAKRELHAIVSPENMWVFLDAHADQIKAVFHLGGISATTATDADAIVAENVDLSQGLWAWCAENKVRFIYGSSFSTYGDGSAGFADVADPAGLARIKPLSLYGWSKHFFDRWVARQVADATAPVPPQWAGLKFFNVYGPNEYHKGEHQSVVCKLYPQAAAGASAKLFKSNHPHYADGAQLRDFIFVQDCVDVMLWLYENPSVSGLFNLGTGKARTFNDLAAALFSAMGKPAKIQYMDMPQTLVDRYQNFAQADMAKLRAAGYTKPFTELEVGVATYVTQYLMQGDMYR